MDLPRREITDTAMGQLGIGPVVYGFNYDPANLLCDSANPDCGTKAAAKFEEFISVILTFLFLHFNYNKI